ncbi:MAG: hypothetical protein KatS3mg111_3868 [Pirellulaceae bacterium]|nr:MAG: hypothetical protein KatS3mg111_3868 [Pirellulaceae bacterium]
MHRVRDESYGRGGEPTSLVTTPEKMPSKSCQHGFYYLPTKVTNERRITDMAVPFVTEQLHRWIALNPSLVYGWQHVVLSERRSSPAADGSRFVLLGPHVLGGLPKAMRSVALPPAGMASGE